MIRTTSSLLHAVLLTLGLAAAAAAEQHAPAAEVFAGYSLLPAGGDDFPRATSHGVQGGVVFNLNGWFGVAGEIGQQWSTTSDLGPNFEGMTAKTTVREYLIGPRFTARSDRANVFAHGWFGRATGDAGENFRGFSDSGLALGGGGGVDVRLTPAVAFRAQFDYVGSFADIVEHNTRFAAGVVIGLGRR